jgi:hypothetical protein
MAARDDANRRKAQLELEEQIAEAIKNSTASLEDFAQAQKKISENYKLMKKIQLEIDELIKIGGKNLKNLTNEEKAQLSTLQQQQEVLVGVNKELSKTKTFALAIGKELLTGGKVLKDYFIPSLTSIFQKFLSINDLTHQTANTLGFQGSKLKAMSDNLSVTRDEFVNMGYEIESAYKAQTALSDATGRQTMLSQSASKAIAETSRITGMAVEDMAGLAGQMEAFGLGAEQSADIVLNLSKEASDMGLNSGKVIKKFQDNLGLMNKLNFKNGVKGMMAMAKFSEKYKIDMNDVAAVADKVFRPEGAIEAAAQLQVLGGSLAALGDPFQLMYKARNAPEELAKSISKAATASATWDETTKEWKINANELDRMKEAASALGMDYTKLVETAKQGAKIKQFEGLLGGKGLSKDEMDALVGVAQMGEKGAFITIKGKDTLLKDIDKGYAKSLLQGNKSRDELAASAKSYQNDFDAIKNKIMIAFVKLFEKIDWAKVIDTLKWAGQKLVDFVTGAENLLGAKGTLLTGLAIYFGGKAALQWGMNAAAGFTKDLVVKGAKGLGGLAKKLVGGGPEIPTKGFKPRSVGMGAGESMEKDGGPGAMTKGINATEMIKGAAAILILSAALFVFAKALQELKTVGLEEIGKAALGLTILGLAAWGISKFEASIIEGAFAIGVLSLALIPFAYSMNMMKDVGIGTIGVLAAGLLVLGIAAEALGATSPLIIAGAVAIAALGIAVIPLAYAFNMVADGISTIVKSFTEMFSVIGPNGASLLMAGLGFIAMAAGVGILTLALVGLGLASILALPGLMIMGSAVDMLVGAASAIESSGGSDGLVKSINAINSVDTDKLNALKDLSMWMALLGGTTTVKFDESLHVDGSIELSGQGGGKTGTDWIKDPIFVSKLKEELAKSTSHQRNGK